MIEQPERSSKSIARIGWTSSHHGGSDRSMLSDRTGLKGIEYVLGEVTSQSPSRFPRLRSVRRGLMLAGCWTRLVGEVARQCPWS